MSATATEAPDRGKPAATLDRLRAGDRDAWGQVYAAHQRSLVSLAVGRLGDVHEAEDVAHEALIRAMGAAPRLRDDTNIGAFLGRVADNLCLDRLRRRQRLRFVPASDLHNGNLILDTIEDGGGSAEEAALASLPIDRAGALWAALARLPERQRAAILLHHLHEWSTADIAVHLGMGRSAVKSMLFRARAALAAAVPALAAAGVSAPRPADPTPAAIRHDHPVPVGPTVAECLPADWLRAAGMWAAWEEIRHIAGDMGRPEGTIAHWVVVVRRRTGAATRPEMAAWLAGHGLARLVPPLSSRCRFMRPGAGLSADEAAALALHAGASYPIVAERLGVSLCRVRVLAARAARKGGAAPRPALTEPRRAALDLWAGGLPVVAVAERLGLSVSATSSRLEHARRIIGVEPGDRAGARAWLAAHPGSRLTRPGGRRAHARGPLTADDRRWLADLAAGVSESAAARARGLPKSSAVAAKARICRRLGLVHWADALAWWREQQRPMAAD